MRTTFAFFGALALLAAGPLFLGAKSAIHEILAALFVLMFLLCAATTAILGALAKIARPGAIPTDHTEIGSAPPPPEAPKNTGFRMIRNG
jgi:hypothetical protein